MKYSLLYKNPEKCEIFDVNYDLSADRAVEYMCSDVKRSDYFLSVLTRPMTDIENIRYRQDILKDFMSIPQLYDDLKTVFNRYDKVKNDWREMRSSAYPASSSVNRRALLEYTFSSLKVTAMFPKTLISFFRSIFDTLSKYDIKSGGLCEIKKYCDDMLKYDSLNEIERIASLFQYKSPESFEFSVAVELDDALKMISCDLCDIKEIDQKQTENVFTRLFSRKKQQNTDIDIESDEATTDDILNIANEALYRIDSALTQVTNDVYEVFFGLSNEMLFYDAALSVCGYLKENNVKICFPEIVEAECDIFSAHSLVDPVLLAEGIEGRNIVSNDAVIESGSDGMLIKGQNKTGKTSYLRAIGIAQLFAQSGLPVCAESAKISIRGGIYTHFSSAEEEFRAGDTAGRFEGEVQIIADIINGVEKHPYSMILMNETFQTTSYSEGAQGMYEILISLPAVKAKYVFVSRLAQLFVLAGQDKNCSAEVVEMNDDFKTEN